MGQAKARGSFEIRKAEGEARLVQEEIDRKRKEAEYEASLTPEQKEKRAQARKTLALLASIANQWKVDGWEGY